MVSSVKQITKSLGKLEDDLVDHILKSNDFTKLRSGQKIDLELNNSDYTLLFKLYGRRLVPKLQNLVQNAISKYWTRRMAECRLPTDENELEKLIEKNIIEGGKKSKETLILQEEAKLHFNEKTNWPFKVYKNVLGEVRVGPEISKPLPLSRIGAAHVEKLVSFECTINGWEAQQAIPDKILTSKSDIINAEDYNKDNHGYIKQIYYDDFQYYWLEENTREYSKKKILRKIPAQAFGRYVGMFETGDKVRVVGIYKTVERDKKSKSPALDVEIEVYTMEKLEADTEITISKEELLELKKLAEVPDEFFAKITSSFAPHIVENMIPKLALLLAAIGSANLGKYRDHIHVYLVGNPGTAKSEMLKALVLLRYLAIYADAPNASARGLMYSQEDWGKRKILKAGLVVKHELVGLDELDKMGDTRQELNTTIEQQFASYHKNPFDVETPINCTVVAAGNPQNGRWVESKTLMDNLKPIEPELLSRFLVIRVFKSGQTTKRMRHIIDTVQDRDTVKPEFTERQIAGLISHCRKLKPKLTKQAEQDIIDFAEFFEGIEQSSDVNLPFETRQEIQIIRISTAIAKLLQKELVDSQCVQLAVKFLKECLQSLGMNTEGKLSQLNLNDQATTRDEAWHQIIRDLQKNSEDGCFSESELISKMLEFEMFWKTKDAAHAYWKRYNPNMQAKSDYYEPKPGRYQKVS